MALSAEDTFNLEVLKLLLFVAWVDGEIEQHEAQMVMGLGRSWSVSEPDLKALMGDVKAGKKVGEPDWALLKTRKDDALSAARARARGRQGEARRVGAAQEGRRLTRLTSPPFIPTGRSRVTRVEHVRRQALHRQPVLRSAGCVPAGWGATAAGSARA